MIRHQKQNLSIVILEAQRLRTLFMFGAVELHAVICGNAINPQKANKKRVLFHVKHEFSLKQT